MISQSLVDCHRNVSDILHLPPIELDPLPPLTVDWGNHNESKGAEEQSESSQPSGHGSFAAHQGCPRAAARLASAMPLLSMVVSRSTLC